MAKIDLKKAVIDRLIAGGKPSGLTYYDVEIESMDVEITSIDYKIKDVKDLDAKVVDTIVLPNCTDILQEATYTWKQEESYSFTWKLGATYTYSEELTAAVDIGVNIGGKTSQSFSLTGEISGTSSKSEGTTFTATAKVPPCTKLTMPIKISETTFDVEAEIHFLVKGKAKGMLSLDWWPDSEVSLIIYEKFSVKATIKGKKGKTFEAGWYPSKADCKEGPCCKKLASVTLTGVDIKAKGIGNDWTFGINVGGTTISGTPEQVKGKTVKIPLEGDTLSVPVAIDITEHDPKYDDKGSGGGVIQINAAQGSGQATIPGSAKAYKADHGSATFGFHFSWKVE
ncbi:MAG: ETX/MTX2 family pore-forming toxin [Bacteroidia bacterium]|nr:ETX/MTX2 family pore-forming toxin [Bacteroidia bacterium]